MTSFVTAGFVYLCPVSQFILETWPEIGQKVSMSGAQPAIQLWPAA